MCVLFVPLGDDSEKTRHPWVTWGLMAMTVVVFVLAPSAEDYAARPFYETWGFSPARWYLPSLLSSMFLHADAIHLCGNLVFLLTFGPALESRVGHGWFTALYLGGGLASHVFFGLLALGSPGWSIGASGAIAAAMGAYFHVLPRYRVRIGYVTLFPRPSAGVVLVAASWLLPLYFAFDLRGALLGQGFVNYLAHLGGYGSGYALARLLVATRRIDRDLRDHEQRDLSRSRRAWLEARAPVPALAEVRARALEADPRRLERERLAKRSMGPAQVAPLVLPGTPPEPRPATPAAPTPAPPEPRPSASGIELQARDDAATDDRPVAVFANAARLPEADRRAPVALAGKMLVLTDPLGEEQLHALTRELAFESGAIADRADRLVRQTQLVVAIDLPRSDAGMLAATAARAVRGMRLIDASALPAAHRVEAVSGFALGPRGLHLRAGTSSRDVRWADVAVVLLAEHDDGAARRSLLELVSRLGARFRLVLADAPGAGGLPVDDVRVLVRRLLQERPELDVDGLLAPFAAGRYAPGPVFFYPSHLDATVRVRLGHLGQENEA